MSAVNSNSNLIGGEKNKSNIGAKTKQDQTLHLNDQLSDNHNEQIVNKRSISLGALAM